ncbi:MAG: hypothetical protein KKB34_05120 [Bacteroidetes bacterium]|nr:hypothetical protein [Bacteroidota bacterium]
MTDARQIDLSNQEVNQLELSYDAQANETEVVIPLLPEHTSDLTVTTLEIDIQSVNSLSSDIVTPASGQLHVNFDVRTEFDNYDLPTEPVTFQQVDASDFKVDSLIWVQEVNGIRTMKEITIAELKTELGI